MMAIDMGLSSATRRAPELVFEAAVQIGLGVMLMERLILWIEGIDRP